LSTLSKNLSKESASVTPDSGERASRLRQRQRLIDACISALHQYGPSRTTVEKVVTIAKLSPGTVSFYFDSKAAMLVAALEFLAAEFETQVLVPVEQAKSDPVRALELLVTLYLDPEIASPRKVSVWYSFWGEANSRKEYYDICGKRDKSFEVLVHGLIDALVRRANAPHLDSDAVALGLIGVLEMMWQEFAFQDEADIDRAQAKRRSLAYLRSIFPLAFSGVGAGAVTITGKPVSLMGRLYDDPAQFERERAALLLPGWHLIGHENDLPTPGDYLSLDLAGERALVLRGDDRALRGFRNTCLHWPHALVDDRQGHAGPVITCAADGIEYEYDDRSLLHPVATAVNGGLVFLQFGGHGAAPVPSLADLSDVNAAIAPIDSALIEADWKLLASLWLEGAASGDDPVIDPDARSVFWTDGHSLLKIAPDTEGEARRGFVFPGLLIEQGPTFTVLAQILPVGPGQSRVRRYVYGPAGSRFDDENARSLSRSLEIARSTQQGMVATSYQRDDALSEPASRAFLAWLAPSLPR
jgi:AcrR family transcriptional regulator